MSFDQQLTVEMVVPEGCGAPYEEVTIGLSPITVGLTPPAKAARIGDSLGNSSVKSRGWLPKLRQPTPSQDSVATTIIEVPSSPEDNNELHKTTPTKPPLTPARQAQLAVALEQQREHRERDCMLHEECDSLCSVINHGRRCISIR